MLVYLIAGEPSGDVLGGRLMAALKARHGPTLTFAGIGGPAMQAQGLSSLFPMGELSLMGIAEVLPHLPRLLRRITETQADIRQRQPRVVVSIDAPSFGLRVQRGLAGSGIPRVHYVAPQVWAWRPGRAKKIARSVDQLLCLLPFEPEFFAQYGLDARFVGHPVVEGAQPGDAARFHARHTLPPTSRPLLILPGSRHGELKRHMPVFLPVLAAVRRQRPDLVPVVPTLPHLQASLAAQDWPVAPIFVTDPDEKRDAYRAATAALAASGTVTLELALAGVPTLVSYRLNLLSGWLARRLVKLPYVSLANLLLKHEALPERLQEECRADILTPALMALLAADGHVRAQTNAQTLHDMLGGTGLSPSAQAAAALDIYFKD